MEKMSVNMLYYISLFLPVKSIYHFGICCKKNSKILNNEKLWKDIALRDHGDDLLLDDEINDWKEFIKEGNFKWDNDFAKNSPLKINYNNKKVSFRDKSTLEKYFYAKVGITSIISKNVFKPNKLYTMRVESYGEFPHACFGLVSTNFNENEKYVCSGKNGIGFSCSYVAYSPLLNKYTQGIPNFAKKRVVLVHHIDLVNNMWTSYNEENEENKNTISLDKIDSKQGLKFGATIYYITDFVRVLDLRHGIHKYSKPKKSFFGSPKKSKDDLQIPSKSMDKTLVQCILN